MEQLRLLTRLIAFLLFAGVMYTIFLVSIPERLSHRHVRNLKVPLGRDGYSFTRLQEAENYGNVDVLFMGSSLTYRGYDPRLFEQAGYRIFNLGSSAQTPIQNEMLAKRYLHKMKPGLVVLEVTPNIFMRDGVESTTDLLANGPVDVHALWMTYQVGHLYGWNSLLYRWSKERLFGPREFTEAPQRGDDSYISGGYVQRALERNARRHFAPGPKQQVYPFQEHAFERMLELFRVRDIPVVLVDPSVTRPYYSHYPDGEVFAARMTATAPYLDMNQLVSLDDSLHFYDTHHLNQEGVELYNAAVIEELEKLGLLPEPN